MIIGIGNDIRGDDAAGLLAARLLKARLRSDPTTALSGSIEVLESSGEMTSLIEAWQGCDEVILIDCSVSGAPRGAIQKIDLLAPNSREILMSASLGLSSHSLDLSGALDLARLLNKLPTRLTQYTVESGDQENSFEVGATASDEVVRAVNQVVCRVIEDLQASPTS
ncbi:MAG: hydrogenase maturation protease [Blastocatellia bacterium]